MLIPWVVFPLVLALLSLGWGALVVRAARTELYARLQAWPDRVRLQMGLPPG